MLSTSQRTSNHFDQLRSWVNELNGTKSAASQGKTSHPSKSVDDGTKKPTQGAQSSDNEKYVKKHVPASVDDSNALGRDQDELQPNIGLTQSEVGKDPSVEDDFKDRPKDPGTSHPADMSIGEKYSSADLRKYAEAIGNLGNSILADFAVAAVPGQPTTKQAETKEATQASSSSPSAAELPSPTGGSSVTSPANTNSAEAGYELARILGLSKEAADSTAQSVVEDAIKQALYLGDRVGQLYLSLHKKAEGEADMPPKPDADDMAMPEASPGGAGGGAEGMMPPAPMVPPGAEGAGAPPGAGGPPGAEGGMDPEQALHALAMAMMEAGISPEQLVEMAKSHAGGGGDPGMPPGAPPGPGGPGGPPDPMQDQVAKVASAVKDYKRSGRFRVREAKTAAEARMRDEMHKYIREIAQR